MYLSITSVDDLTDSMGWQEQELDKRNTFYFKFQVIEFNSTNWIEVSTCIILYDALLKMMR